MATLSRVTLPHEGRVKSVRDKVSGDKVTVDEVSVHRNRWNNAMDMSTARKLWPYMYLSGFDVALVVRVFGIVETIGSLEHACKIVMHSYQGGKSISKCSQTCRATWLSGLRHCMLLASSEGRVWGLSPGLRKTQMENWR